MSEIQEKSVYRMISSAAVFILLFAALIIFSACRVKADERTGSYNRTEMKKQVYGLPRKEIVSLMKKCVKKTRKWDYRCVISAPVWMGGRRWDCSTFIMYFYNEYVLPRAAVLNRSGDYTVTDEAGQTLRPWVYYPYQAKNGSLMINNTATILGRVGTPWKKSRVNSLVKAYKAYQKGKKRMNTSLLPEVGDILLYGRKENKQYKVQHVGIYLGECRGKGKGYYMAECTMNIARKTLGMKKKQVTGNRNGAAINPFWVSSAGKKQTLLWVKRFVVPKKKKGRQP